MTETLAQRRMRLMGPNVPTFHDPPLHIVRGRGVWLWDAAGRRYLDAYNNVPHVGHCHPVVVAAIARQAAALNVHARYLHEGVLDYIDRLTATMAHGLSQMLMVCTGSEANDVALRMAQAATGRTGIIATDATYHGNTTATAQLSTRRPPIGGYPPHVRLVAAPRAGDGDRFAADVARAAKDLDSEGFGLSALIVCPIFANEGMPDTAPGYLDPAVDAVRGAGGLIICDEVQSGFGRLGSEMWGHDRMGFAPDVVTLGKAMGNGYPVAGVVARPAVMAAFRRAFGYVNTFAGTPVAAAAAMAVLDAMDADALAENAARSGAHLLGRLAGLADPRIARVTGRGLFLAVELGHGDGLPATGLAERVVEALRTDGVLIGRIGPDMNILKIRPPLPFTTAHGDRLADALARALVRCGDG